MSPKSLFPTLRLSGANPPIVSSRGALLGLPAILLLAAACGAPTASAQTVTYAGTGALNFGSANVCPAGKTVPAPCSKTLTLTYHVTGSGTLGTPQALSTGQPNLDYKVASGSSCTGNVTEGNTCTVNVAFAPIAPGARNGAVEIVGASGDVLATTYIYGTGVGPAVAFDLPLNVAAPIELNSTINTLSVTVDANANVFVLDLDADELKEILAEGGYTTIRTLATGFHDPSGLAVDGAGNVFVADTKASEVKEVLQAGDYTTIKSLGSGFSQPNGVAVDGSGNDFVSDYGNKAVKEILAAGAYTTVKTIGSGFGGTYGVAVDGNANVFVSDPFNDAVKEILAAGGYTTVNTLAGNLDAPAGLAVDASGNVYFINTNFIGTINEIVAADGYATISSLAQMDGAPYGLALDAGGNIYVAVYGYGETVELVRSQPPSFAFGQINVGTISSPKSVTIQNIGNTNLAGTLSVSPEWAQVAGSGTPSDCTASFSLLPSVECDLSISFEPTAPGNKSGAASLTDNALNVTGAVQSILLSGTGAGSAPIPEIRSLNWTYGAPYSVVIIYGFNFGATQGSSTVTFNGVATPHYYWASNEIYVTVPPTATTGNLVVTVNGVSSNLVPFTILPQPKITGISPPSGSVGTTVSINGQNLLDYMHNGSVTFNGKYLPIVSATSTAIQVTVPAGAVSGPLHVLVNDTGMDSPTFTVTQ